MNKKRIRGLKRHLRNHQQRAIIQEPFNEERMRNMGYDYANLGLKPWRVNGKPPVSIRKLWVSHLVANYSEWYEQMATRYDDFYLAVWLFDPTFGESQVVAAIGERMDGYAEMHGDMLELPLPPEYQSLPRINDLRWTAHKYLMPYWPDDFAAMGKWAARKPHWPGKDSNGDPLVVVQLGIVWVGQKA
jgi:hypothetical protein